jgi:protein O-mannosyl-transferase
MRMDQPNTDGSTRGKDTSRKQTVLLCVLLALITAAAYWPVARLGFINLDDVDYVSSNPRVKAGLTAESVKWAFTSAYASNWHPLTWLSHELDCQVYALKAGGHHVTNLLFHMANTLLLFGLLKRLTGAVWRSAFVAALFALHPLHVESVAWVSERKDVLSGFFFFLTLWAYARYANAECRMQNAECRRQEPASRSTQHNPRSTLHAQRFYVLSLVCFALGLMSKPMLVTVPFVLLLLDYWPLGRMTADYRRSARESQLSVKRLLLEKLPFFVLSAASCVVTVLAQRAFGAMVPLDKTPIEARLANALVAYARYLGNTVWPAKLAVYYPYVPLDLDSGQAVAAGLLLLAITVLVIATARVGARSVASHFPLGKRRGAFLPEQGCPYLLVGWLWFLGMLVPVIGLVQVGKQALADRYMYLPQIGLFIVVAWGAAGVASRLARPRLVAAVGSALVLAACGILTARQLSYWRSTWALFEHAAAVTPRNFMAYAALGSEYATQSKWAEAIAQCQKALAIAPGYPEALFTLGAVYAKQDKYDEAIANYRAAAEGDKAYPDPHIGLANVLVKQRKFAEAEAECREGLRLAPLDMPAMYCLATALQSQGKLDEAADYYRRIIALDPTLFTPRRLLAGILVTQGKADEALAQLLTAAKIRPKDGDTRTVLGVVLLGKNRTDEAVAQLTEAARLQSTNALANYQLALIYQGRKQTRAAIERFRLALKAQPDWPESLNNLAWILAANPDASVRNGAEAVILAERACKQTGYKEPLLLGTLAAAYAEAGRFPEAVSFAEKARALALAAGQTEVAQKNQELLELYRAGRAYHESE